MTIIELVCERRVVVCVGSGGVGKTTLAATLGLLAARAGRRVVVVTIDPARRLADALGMGGALGGEPRRLPIDGVDDVAGIGGESGGGESGGEAGGGELWASMLDSRATFDRLVREEAADGEQAQRILANPYYRSLSGSLSGTQEYMAAEELHRLAAADRFDLVVVDTPPSRQALDFVDAPERLVRLLDNRIYRTLVAPSRGVARALGAAARAFLRTAAGVVGAQVLDDAVRFFTAFDGMEAGFRARSMEVTELLAGPDCGFVLVASPRPDTVAEAEVLLDALAARGIDPAALVVNLLHPDPLAGSDVEPVATGPLAGHWRAALDLAATARRERDAIAALTARFDPGDVVLAERRDDDIRDLDGLARFGAHLTDVGA